MQRSDFRCVHRLRVRWAEVDMQKDRVQRALPHVHRHAMSDYWRALALPYEASMHPGRRDVCEEGHGRIPRLGAPG
jgi:hypothetical protein